MPIVLVAYSGGYLPAAWCAAKGGLRDRVRGVILLDALYGEVDKFASWIARDRSAFFVSTYLGSTEDKNAELERVLADRAVAFDTALEPRLEPGSVTIFPGGENLKHRDLVTHAWVENPVADLLRRLRQYRR
jgi:pimeloyl-ACP methyl ester carboxylesterase